MSGFTGGFRGPTSSTSGDLMTFADATGMLASDSGLTIAQGNWTPTLTFGGASVGITYGNQVGRYLKIGNAVILNGYFQLSSKGSSTGQVNITGLPFTSRAGAQFLGISSSTGLSVVGPLVFAFTLANTSVQVQQQSTAGAASAVTDTHFAATTDFGVFGVYFTA